jgi:hypothetical protein
MDWSTVKHPSGASVVQVHDGNSYRFLCRLSSNAWAIYSVSLNDWSTCDDTFTADEMVKNGWGKYMTKTPIWITSTIQPAKPQAQCVCDMQTLMCAGCPSSRGKLCRSR